MSDEKQLEVSNPSRLIEIAINQNADVDKLSKLMDMQERWEANEAKKAYVRAISAFRAECPAIAKTRKAYDSTYAGLAETIDTIKPILEKHGLSHSWKTSQQGDSIAVQCCVTHIMGHTECTTLQGPPDKTGSKNSIQAIGSTVAYLERYTLYAILGLASMDDDGMAAGGKPKITDEQAMQIDAAITENELNREKFMAWLGSFLKCDSIADINADAFDTVWKRIQSAIRAKQ